MANDPKPDLVRSAEDKIDEVTDPGRRGEDARVSDRPADVASLEEEQRTESGSSNAQSKGLVVGILVGGLIGLLVMLPLAFIPIGGLALVGRLLICGIVGAFAGGTAGAVYLGGRMPELEGETVDSGGRPSRGSTPRDSRSDSRGR